MSNLRSLMKIDLNKEFSAAYFSITIDVHSDFTGTDKSFFSRLNDPLIDLIAEEL